MTDLAAQPELSLVICTLDEAEAIGPVIAEARRVLADVSFEIIVVDDSSGSETVDAVRDAAGDDARIRVVHRQAARGLASAAIEGWRHARGAVLGVMDGDGQHDAQLLGALLDQVRAGADFAIASRFAPSGSLGLTGLRRALSCVGTAAVQRVLGARTSDPLSGFFLMKRACFAAASPRLTGVGFKILADLLVSGPPAPKVSEVATSLRPRLGGESKLDLRVVIELGAQLVERKSDGVIKARFTLFACVGASGLVVHSAALASLQQFMPFSAAQGAAILTAMVSNYYLNNLLTFRDLRLQGGAFWQGLCGFVLACLGGAAINELSATVLAELGVHWLLAGVSGALLAATWNYVSTSQIAWGAQQRADGPLRRLAGRGQVSPTF